MGAQRIAGLRDLLNQKFTCTMQNLDRLLIFCFDPDKPHRRAAYRFANRRRVGPVILLPPRDEDYGGRDYTCRDPEGNVWSFGTYDPWAAVGA